MAKLSPIPVRLGSLHFDVLSSSEAMHAKLADRFQGFIRKHPTPAHRLDLKVGGTLSPPTASGPGGESSPHCLRIVEAGFSLDYTEAGRSFGVLDPTRVERNLGPTAMDLSDDPLTTALLHYISLLAIDHDQLLVHAGAVQVGRAALVFPGESGRGKSTLAAMFSTEQIVNDEFVLLSTAPFRCASTPFFGTSMPEQRGHWTSAALGAFLRLHQRAQSEVAPAASEDLFRLLLGSVAVPEQSPTHRSRAFELAAAFQSLPGFDFGFSLDGDETRAAIAALAVQLA